MAKAFQDIKVGDQLIMPFGRSYWARTSSGGLSEIDPRKPVMVVVVTHRWYDPHDDKEYVGISTVKKDGSFRERPDYKHTLTGLAQQGYYLADKDYIGHAKAIETAKENKQVVSIVDFKRKQKR